MTYKEFLDLVEATAINDKAVARLEDVYLVELPEIIKRIASLVEKTDIVEEKRLLTLSEIVSADDDLDTDFKRRKLIPVFDNMDNDFIAYDLQKKVWTMFNIVDMCQFGKRKRLDAYFNKESPKASHLQ